MIDPDKLRQIIEAALLAADEPLTVDQFARLFRPAEIDAETIRADIRDSLKMLEDQAAGRGYELKRVASGYRYQVRQELSQWVSRLWEEKPPRYSRALLETLALVAYKQPVTRGDIEQIRGVSVSQNIVRTMLERGWIRVVGRREVPGHPAMYGTTKAFLDYFNLQSLDDLPPLAEIRALIEPLVAAESTVADPPSVIPSGDDSGNDSDTDNDPADLPTNVPEQAELASAATPPRSIDVESLTVTSVDTPDADQPEQRSAEVVQLPTAPR
jgi:segregation and condensation protein B